MNFNPQIAFRKQPMVYVTAALIGGILLSRLIDILIFPSTAVIMLVFILISIKKWKYTFLLQIVIINGLGILTSIQKNRSFNESIKKLEQFNESEFDFSGIVVESTEYSSGQRFVLRNIQLLSEDIVYKSDAKYIVYPKEKKIDGVTLGDTLRGTGKWQLFNDVHNSGECNFKRHYHNKKIAGKIYSKENIQVYSNPNGSIVKS